MLKFELIRNALFKRVLILLILYLYHVKLKKLIPKPVKHVFRKTEVKNLSERLVILQSKKDNRPLLSNSQVKFILGCLLLR